MFPQLPAGKRGWKCLGVLRGFWGGWKPCCQTPVHHETPVTDMEATMGFHGGLGGSVGVLKSAPLLPPPAHQGWLGLLHWPHLPQPQNCWAPLWAFPPNLSEVGRVGTNQAPHQVATHLRTKQKTKGRKSAHAYPNCPNHGPRLLRGLGHAIDFIYKNYLQECLQRMLHKSGVACKIKAFNFPSGRATAFSAKPWG